MTLELGALLAFVVAAYAILIQTSKTNSPATSVHLLIVAASVIALLFSGAELIRSIEPALAGEQKALVELFKASLMFCISAILFYLALGDITVRLYYRTDRMVLVRRQWYRIERLFGRRRDGEHAPIDFVLLRNLFADYLYQSEGDLKGLFTRAERHRQSLSVLVTKARKQVHNDELAALVLNCLTCTSSRVLVEYVCCIRHPAEFIEDLITVNSKRMGNVDRETSIAFLSTEDVRSRLILIDAHTPHFGFAEPVYFAREHELRKLSLGILKSDKSFAGVHTALGKGYGLSRKSITPEKRDLSPMTVVVLDELTALCELDNPEQLRLFMRHVVASEHLMGGILTVLYESRSGLSRNPFLAEIVDHHASFHEQHEVAFAPWQIKHGVESVANDISQMFKRVSRPANRKVVLIAVAEGGRLFAADLEARLRARIPEFDRYFELGEVRTRKYEPGQEPRKQVDVDSTSLRHDLTDKIVLIADDICHGGDTLKSLVDWAHSRGANQVWSAVVIHRANCFEPDHFAIRFQDIYDGYDSAWMYGYGMDRSDGSTASRRLPCFVFERTQEEG